MTLNFCTLFNSAYLTRGLVLYHSLKSNCPDFNLYVFAFDEKTYDFLKKKNYPNLIPVSLKEFEDSELLRVKSGRTAGEYCWTCTSSTILFCLNTFDLQNCTYVDADLCFYSNPAILIDEMGDSSVLITEHRYSPQYDQSITSGKYCVQFVCFKNNTEGLKVLNWWRNACIDWCYARVEDGKFGDQKYLDDWTTRFKGVHELQNLGGGLAPWNIQQYEFNTENNKVEGVERSGGKKFEPVFFHFHSLKFFEKEIVLLSDSKYDLSKNVKDLFYKKYVKELCEQQEIVRKADPSINANGVSGPAAYLPMSFSTILKYYFENIRSSKKNIFGRNLSNRMKHHHYYYTRSF